MNTRILLTKKNDFEIKVLSMTLSGMENAILPLRWFFNIVGQHLGVRIDFKSSEGIADRMRAYSQKEWAFVFNALDTDTKNGHDHVL